MKDKISISLFFSCIVICFCIGIAIGLNFRESLAKDAPKTVEESKAPLIKMPDNLIIHEEATIPVSNNEEKVTADTSYVVLEKDMDSGKIVKAKYALPEKYIGLTREQLLEQLLLVEANPPLTELERGFVSLELISFSKEQIQVQMNYQYVEPTGSFYIMAYDHYIVVMLDDKKTVFLSTNIKLSDLPVDIQQDIMRGLFIPNEESLYDFLERYTS